MSVALLRDPQKSHEISDDIESCLWVFYKMALHFFEHTFLLHRRIDMATVFDEMKEGQTTDGAVYAYGGNAKYTHLMGRQFTEVTFDSAPLTRILHTFGSVFRKLYVIESMVNEDDLPGDVDVQRLLYDAQKQKIEDVIDIIKIFDDELGKSDWPEDDAVPDQYLQTTALQSYQQIKSARQESFLHPVIEHPSLPIHATQGLGPSAAEGDRVESAPPTNDGTHASSSRQALHPHTTVSQQQVRPLLGHALHQSETNDLQRRRRQTFVFQIWVRRG